MKAIRIIFLSLFYLFLYTPIIILIIYSFNQGNTPLLWEGKSLKWYYALSERLDLLEAFINSFLIAISSALLAIILSIFAVISIGLNCRYAFIFKFFYGNLLIPEIVLAIALLLMFIASKMPLGPITLLIAHTVMGIGYAFPLIYQRWLEFDMTLINASYDLGATTYQTWRHVILPILFPALFTSGILVFILSFDDFLLAYFCSMPDFQTLPIAFLSMLRVGISPEFNALATIMFLLAGICVLIYYITQIKKSHSQEIL